MFRTFTDFVYTVTFFFSRDDPKEYALKLIEGTGISMSACREIAVSVCVCVCVRLCIRLCIRVYMHVRSVHFACLEIHVFESHTKPLNIKCALCACTCT